MILMPCAYTIETAIHLTFVDWPHSIVCVQIFAFLTEKEEKAKIIIYIFVCVWQLHASVIQVLLTELKLY